MVGASPAFAAPLNDRFSSATVIQALPFHDNKDLRADPPNRRDSSDPFDSCTGLRGFRTVWYKIVGNDNWFDTNTYGSDYDTTIAVYQNANGILTEVACNDDTWRNLSSEVGFFGQAGMEYYIKVGSYDSFGQGYLDFCVDIWGDLPCR
jgi:hypothetical protein